MDKATLEDHIDFIQARIEEIEGQVLNYDPDKRGYKELMIVYNNLVDRYHELLDKLEHFGEKDIELRKLELEEKRLKLNEEIEKRKLSLEESKFEFERIKDVRDREHQSNRELIDDIFEAIGLAARIAVPIASLTGVIYLGNLAYMSDAEMKLCNGRIIGRAGDIFKILTLKV